MPPSSARSSWVSSRGTWQAIEHDRKNRENAVSDAPIHQAYRQALVQEPVVDAVGAKRQLDREDALFELEIQERKLALEQGNWHERRSAPSSAPGLGEERRFHSRAATEKHSMKCVCAQSLVCMSYSSHPGRSYSAHPSECLRDKQRRRNVFLKALSKEKHSMKCVCEHLVKNKHSMMTGAFLNWAGLYQLGPGHEPAHMGKVRPRPAVLS